MKKCSKCKKEKELSGFSICNAKKDGRQNQCKECQRLYIKNNRKKIILYQRKYRNDNAEKVNDSRKKYNINNPEKVKKAKKNWCDNNKDYYKIYRQENKEQIRKNNQRWEKNNPGKVRAKCRRRRANKRFVSENYTVADETITYRIFGHRCFKCNTVDDITVDHHKPLLNKNALSVTNAVPLCRSCNSSKGILQPEEFYTSKELHNIISKFEMVSGMIK